MQERFLYRDAEGRWRVAQGTEERASEADFEALPLPGSVRDLVARRLDGLTDGARDLLRRGLCAGTRGPGLDPPRGVGESGARFHGGERRADREAGVVEEKTGPLPQAGRIQKRIGDRRLAALSLNNLGTLLHQAGRLGEAQEQYEQVQARR